jgi:Kinesin motor domain
MQGDGKAGGGQAGIIQSVISDIFRFSRIGEHSSRNFTMNICYVEVYNERVRDLLSDDVGDNYSQGTPTETPAAHDGPEVQIQTGPSGEVILNCVTKQIQTIDDALELLVLGNSNRIVAKTNANIHSSRSHAIFRINVQSTSKENGPGAELLRIADFFLVDLAGSESTKGVGANTNRQKESANIEQGYVLLHPWFYFDCLGQQ